MTEALFREDARLRECEAMILRADALHVVLDRTVFYPVDGCSITADYVRPDFHMNEPLDKEALTEGLA